MELKRVYSRADRGVYANTASGHFATNHSHINYYVDLTNMKSSLQAAKKAASLLAGHYQNTMVETILCLEGTNMLGAFMADELSRSSPFGVNQNSDIYILAPELNSNNQMIFRENTQDVIHGKSILLFLASVSTGMTLNRALDCLSYYKGNLVGVCAGFSAIREYNGVKVNAVFTEEDFPGYKTYLPGGCEICSNNLKIDAIVSNYGFSPL